MVTAAAENAPFPYVLFLYYSSSSCTVSLPREPWVCCFAVLEASRSGSRAAAPFLLMNSRGGRCSPAGRHGAGEGLRRCSLPILLQVGMPQGCVGICDGDRGGLLLVPTAPEGFGEPWLGLLLVCTTVFLCCYCSSLFVSSCVQVGKERERAGL